MRPRRPRVECIRYIILHARIRRHRLKFQIPGRRQTRGAVVEALHLGPAVLERFCDGHAHAWDAAEPWQVALAAGARVAVTKTLEDGWSEVKRLDDGASGLVPTGYLEFEAVSANARV